jgi:hypothetical protein
MGIGVKTFESLLCICTHSKWEVRQGEIIFHRGSIRNFVPVNELSLDLTWI